MGLIQTGSSGESVSLHVKDKTKPVYSEVTIHKKKPLKRVTFCEGGQPEYSAGRKRP
jgi:hypothetical protein